ncbi:MAG: GIN domain-containing protein [Chitinophagales bacterium]
MNKTISINLGGVFFHIEDNAYLQLEKYLNTLSQYFAKEEGANEIIEDIESRIAEMFQELLQKHHRQVILLSDVNMTIEVMGQPKDFDADIDNSGAFETPQNEKQQQQEQQQHFGEANNEPNNRQQNRRLYRNPDEKVIAGVCSGLSAYFGINDPIWLRLAAVFSVILGAGFPIPVYIIMAIIVPEAKTTAQKLAMKGEKINVSNMEKNFREGIDEIRMSFDDFSKSENGRKTKSFFSKLGEKLRKAWPKASFLVAKLISIFIVFMAMVLLIGLAALLLNFLASAISLAPMLIKFLFGTALPLIVVVACVFMLIFIPISFLIYTVTRRTFRFKPKRYKTHWGRIMTVLWFVALGILLATTGNTANSFSEQGVAKQTASLGFSGDILNLDLLKKDDIHEKAVSNMFFDNNVFFDEENSKMYVKSVQLDVEQAEGDEFQLVLRKKAKGNNKQSARRVAEQLVIEEKLDGETLHINPYIEISEADKWRNQEAQLTLLVPVGKSVHLKEDAGDFIYDIKNTTNTYDGEMLGKTWTMLAEGLTLEGGQKGELGLKNHSKAPDAPTPPDAPNLSSASKSSDAKSIDWNFPSKKVKGQEKKFDFENFEELSISGWFEVLVTQSDEYDVTLVGNQKILDKLEVTERGGTLHIDFDDDSSWFSKKFENEKINVYISMPELEAVSLSGVTKAAIKDFNVNAITLELTGASSCKALIRADDMDIDLSGSSKLQLAGSTESVQMDLSGATQLEAFDFRANLAEVDISGASRAEISVGESLEGEASGASVLSYKGNTPNIDIDRSGVAKVSKAQ